MPKLAFTYFLCYNIFIYHKGGTFMRKEPFFHWDEYSGHTTCIIENDKG
jgi:hypothetical protein